MVGFIIFVSFIVSFIGYAVYDLHSQVKNMPDYDDIENNEINKEN